MSLLLKIKLLNEVKKKFFKGRKFEHMQSDKWLEDEETSFFLNSSGSAFKSINLKRISNIMGIDVSTYAFRRIVSTWALSHELEQIRNAETEALQHSMRVATNAYQQNKQLKPQMITQQYISEERLYPKSFQQEMDKIELLDLNNFI